MQPYKDHLPMGPAELLDKDAEKAKKQIENTFKKGADEIKIFVPTPEQKRQMREKIIKEINKLRKRK